MSFLFRINVGRCKSFATYRKLRSKLRSFGNFQSIVQRTGVAKHLKDFRIVRTVRPVAPMLPFRDPASLFREAERRGTLLSVHGPGVGFPFQDSGKKNDAAA